LDAALPMFPMRQLRWHYRSEHESLIAFSNHHFYDDQIMLFPSPHNKSEDLNFHHARSLFQKCLSIIENQQQESDVFNLKSKVLLNLLRLDIQTKAIRSSNLSKNSILLAGLSEYADPPIPGVKKELHKIQSIMKKGKILLDVDFTVDNLKKELRNTTYSNIVIATHGYFGKNYEQCYLSAYIY